MSEPDERHDECPTITEKEAREKFKEYLIDEKGWDEEDAINFIWGFDRIRFKKEFENFVNERQGINFYIEDWDNDIATASYCGVR